MPVQEFDPRVYFAAERTMLAWLRTGLTVMALGFVIARFGLFVRLLAVQLPGSALHPRSGLTALVGTGMVAAGTVMIAAAAVQHRRFIAALPAADRPTSNAGGILLTLSSLFIAIVGFVLTIYLAESSD